MKKFFLLISVMYIACLEQNTQYNKPKLTFFKFLSLKDSLKQVDKNGGVFNVLFELDNLSNDTIIIPVVNNIHDTLVTILSTKLSKFKNGEKEIISEYPSIFHGFGMDYKLYCIKPHQKVIVIVGCGIDMKEKRFISDTFRIVLPYKNKFSDKKFQNIFYKTDVINGIVNWN